MRILITGDGEQLIYDFQSVCDHPLCPPFAILRVPLNKVVILELLWDGPL